MSGYTKLFSAILTSSVWDHDAPTRLVWITMLAMCDRFGVVEATAGGIAHMARVPKEQAERALAVFLAPDDESRSKEWEGRRLEEIDGGYRILNYLKYREKQRNDERTEYFREKKREQRAKDKSTMSTKSPLGPPIADADADAKTKTKTKTPPLSPKGEVSFPSELDTPEFREAWSSWVAYRTEAHKKLTPSTISGQLKKLAAWGPATAAASIRQSIEAGWQGLFEPKDDKKAAPAEDDYERMGRFFKKKGLRENALLDQYKETN